MSRIDNDTDLIKSNQVLEKCMGSMSEWDWFRVEKREGTVSKNTQWIYSVPLHSLLET